MQYTIMKPEIGFIKGIIKSEHTKPYSPSANCSSQGVSRQYQKAKEKGCTNLTTLTAA